ncbi:MAG: hypothetical protein A2W91_00425 [Bacteroidetes bacterium GWF2_38_335]|nr:MAG: hypothetical protein A2W91_00425 [Bacteroidetes bacterium GWF2_38_335]OFY78298.1 MAG: hypothetical protein A2281_03805 [Bacteroidetes bacterium RIFOXYA12_FULL_38_20]HBS87507.1 hypothetical protein [Bacteroidales bacterium]
MKKLSVIIIFSILIAACTSEKEKPEADKSQIVKEITELENQVMDVPDPEKVSKLIAKYLEFEKAFEGDTAIPEYLFKAAVWSKNLMKSREAIKIFDRIITSFPDYKKVPMCLFYKAMVFGDDIGDFKTAKELYLLFLEKYPNHDFAQSAKASIENLGLTPEELVAKWEKEGKTDSIK